MNRAGEVNGLGEAVEVVVVTGWRLGVSTSVYVREGEER